MALHLTAPHSNVVPALFLAFLGSLFLFAFRLCISRTATVPAAPLLHVGFQTPRLRKHRLFLKIGFALKENSVCQATPCRRMDCGPVSRNYLDEEILQLRNCAVAQDFDVETLVIHFRRRVNAQGVTVLSEAAMALIGRAQKLRHLHQWPVLSAVRRTTECRSLDTVPSS